MSKSSYNFNISLSILNHLGRNLYRSFVTVLGEAISNSWDADAENVWIYVDRDNNNLVVKDDGIGMNEADFQNKFLKIGYSKRKDNNIKSPIGRPYIGNKGIGKLALLSCSEKVSVISKSKDLDYTGGTIDNSGLDEAIKDDLDSKDYKLENYDKKKFEKYTKNHDNGTIILFEKIHEGIKNREGYLRQIIALYFRFSLVDESFKIYFNDREITFKDLDKLSGKTQFLWTINLEDDPYFKELKNLKDKRVSSFIKDKKINGFIASVDKPKDLKIFTTDEKVTIDLFVNGRLREKDFTTRYIPSDRLATSYFYGQIHYDDLDDNKKDRFTSSREGILADDKKYKDFLSNFEKEVFSKIIDEWDNLRIEHRKPGDQENPNRKIEKSSQNLANAVFEDFMEDEDINKSIKNKSKEEEYIKIVKSWITSLNDDAKFNAELYMKCFISENLLRKYIDTNEVIETFKNDNNTKSAIEKILKSIEENKSSEINSKGLGNIDFEIRENTSDSSYLSMSDLSELVDKRNLIKESSLVRHANEMKPIRNLIMHTGIVTKLAKDRLNTIYSNIRARIRELLFNNKKNN